jgi:hypothetical protein
MELPVMMRSAGPQGLGGDHTEVGFGSRSHGRDSRRRLQGSNSARVEHRSWNILRLRAFLSYAVVTRPSTGEMPRCGAWPMSLAPNEGVALNDQFTFRCSKCHAQTVYSANNSSSDRQDVRLEITPDHYRALTGKRLGGNSAPAWSGPGSG